MSEDKKTGGCLCGAVSYSFKESSVISAHHCHCKDCQKSTGSGKATIIIVPEAALEIEGEIKFFMDGDKKFPTICGTGTEDYFCGSYNFDVNGYCDEYSGFSDTSPFKNIYLEQMDNNEYAAIEPRLGSKYYGYYIESNRPEVASYNIYRSNLSNNSQH